MYAYTSLMVIEVERAISDPIMSENAKPGYAIEDIDFGLTPRTSTDLQVKKTVSNIKLVLQDGTTVFDATIEEIKDSKVPGVKLNGNINDGHITIEMSDELISGATIEMTYTITAINNSEYDSVTYYKDLNGNTVALALYEEDANKLVYYEENQIRKHNDTDNTTELVSFNSAKNIVETTTTPAYVADFVSNDFIFSKTNYTGAKVNDGWNIYSDTKDNFIDKYYNIYDNDGGSKLPKELQNLDNTEVYDYSYIVYANDGNPLISNALKHKTSSSSEIVLSKIISTSTDEEFEIENYVRILGINNTVSKLQNIIKDRSTSTTITEPTGGNNNNYNNIIIITLIVATIICIGIILIKKIILR